MVDGEVVLWRATTCLYYPCLSSSLIVLCLFCVRPVLLFCSVCRTHPVGCGLASDSASRRARAAPRAPPRTLPSPSPLSLPIGTARDGTGSTQAGRTQTQAQSTHRETAVSSTAWLGWLLSSFLSVLLLIIPVSAGSVRSLHSVPSTCVLSSSSSLLHLLS